MKAESFARSVCHLILAHRDPCQVANLVEAISAEGETVIVHVDKRVEELPFRRAVNSIVASGTTHFVQARHAVKWGGWSMVQASRQLIAEALQIGPHLERFVLLSGDSYPVTSTQVRNTFYRKNSTVQFANITEFPNSVLGKPASRLENLHLATSSRSGLVACFSGMVHRLVRNPHYPSGLGGRQAYAGSQWWAITRDMAMEIVEELEDSTKLARMCQWSKIPDEHAFHVVIGNSPLASPIRPSVMFSRFTGGASPAFIDDVDLGQLDTDRCQIDMGYGLQTVLYVRKLGADWKPMSNKIERDLWTGSSDNRSTDPANGCEGLEEGP
jgi:hypothetical protein